MYQIAVIGRSLSSENFEVVFDMLDDGVEAGKLEYKKYNIDATKFIPASDAYIFIATRPKVVDGKLYIHIQANDSEDVIIAKVQELGAKLNATKSNSVDISDTSNTSGSSVGCSNDSNNDDIRPLRGVTLSIDGRDIRLSKEDMESLKSLMELCKEHNFKIKEVICE